MSVKHQSWTFIEEGYDSLLRHNWQIQPMIDLVDHIISSACSLRLYAFTSLDVLVISLYEDIDRLSEALHVKYDQHKKQFLFSYYGGRTSAKQPEWERTYPPDLGIEKFDQFINMIKW